MGHGRLYSLCILFSFLLCFCFVLFALCFVLFYLPSKENVCLCAIVYVWIYIHTTYISIYMAL